MPKIKGNGQASIFSDADLAKIRKNIRNPKHRLLFDIARWTGERIGAVRQLDVADVYDLSGAPRTTINFRAQTRKADTGGRRRTRECPVHPQLREILAAYHAPIAGPLFPGAAGPLSYSSVYFFLHRAIERAGLEDRGYSTHSFRRTLITRLSERGVDVRTIQAITGHQDVKCLLRYVEADPRRAQRAISLL